jgi:hypothetical protein
MFTKGIGGRQEGGPPGSHQLRAIVKNEKLRRMGLGLQTGIGIADFIAL